MSDVRLNAVRWKCRRGILELDLFLNHIIDQHYAYFSEKQKVAFEDFLETPDQVMLDWLLGRQVPPKTLYIDFMNLFREGNSK